MIRPCVAVRAAVFAASICIDAVAKRDVGAVVLTDDALRVIEEEFGADSLQLAEELGIVLEVGVVGDRVCRGKPIRWLDGGTATMQDGVETESTFFLCHVILREWARAFRRGTNEDERERKRFVHFAAF